MKELEAQLHGLVGMDRLRDAGAALIASMPAGQTGLRDEVVAWQAELAQTERQHRTDELAPTDYAKARKRLAFKLLAIGHALAETNPAPVATAVAAPVFMSYNHSDASAAGEVRAALEAAARAVRIDIRAGARSGAQALTHFAERFAADPALRDEALVLHMDTPDPGSGAAHTTLEQEMLVRFVG